MTIEELIKLKSEQQIIAQATRYGEQVGLLEGRGLEQDRANVIVAWLRFENQVVSAFGFSAALIRNAYWGAYCRSRYFYD